MYYMIYYIAIVKLIDLQVIFKLIVAFIVGFVFSQEQPWII